MQFTEVFMGLQQGTIDGEENPYMNIVGNNLQEVQRYIIETNHVGHIITFFINNGLYESPDDKTRALAETVDLAGELGCPVAVHVTDPVMDLEKLAGILRPGDIVCHCYQGKGTETILNRDGTVRAGILEARKRGVLFDASNGRNNYDLEVCRQAIVPQMTMKGGKIVYCQADFN